MLVTQNTRPAVNSSFDLSQYIKPDWNHAGKYMRLGKNVIEIPVDPSGKLGSSILIQNTGRILNSKENSISSFILLNDGKNYSAYVMTLIADSDYVKSDPGWAAHNTYRKRDPAFSGLLLYFTPRGQFVNGYAFKNGRQVIQTIQDAAPAVKTRSIQKGTIREAEPQEYNCIFVYDVTTVNGVVVSQTFLYALCSPISGTDPGPPPAGSGGAPSSAPPPPPQCQPNTASPSAVTNNHSLTRVTQPPPGGDDGGMPPPQTCPTETIVADTTPPTPCQQVIALASNSDFKTLMTTLKNETGQNYENAYTFNIDANGNVTSNSFQGIPNSSSVALNFSSGAVDGYAHDHYAGDMPTFSEADIQQIYNMMQQNQMKNPSTFTAAVVTAPGTTYVIKNK